MIWKTCCTPHVLDPDANGGRKPVMQTLGVGLNPALSERGSWPPGGSELVFSLRQVVVDTLDEDHIETDEGERKTGGG